jgi:hypothetical protein
MEIGGFLLGAVVSAAAAKVLWNKEKAKHDSVLNALKEEVAAAEKASTKQESAPQKEAPEKKASVKKAPAKKKPAASKKKAATAEDIEGKIKEAVSKLKDSGERVSLAAVSRESGISYSRIKREKSLVEKYK